MLKFDANPPYVQNDFETLKLITSMWNMKGNTVTLEQIPLETFFFLLMAVCVSQDY